MESELAYQLWTLSKLLNLCFSFLIHEIVIIRAPISMDYCTDLKSPKMLIIRGNSKTRCPIAEVLYHRTSVDRVGLMR